MGAEGVTVAEGWPSAAAVFAKLAGEADATAARLGHKMTDWVAHAEGWRSRCVRTGCAARADISPRTFGRAPLRGEAVTFVCPPPKRKP